MKPVIMHVLHQGHRISIAAVIVFIGLVLSIYAENSRSADCLDSSGTWNKLAYDHYTHGDFLEALHAVQSAPPCSWTDQQLVFNSYMALYLQKASEKLKNEALEAISVFEKAPNWLADPGPLLIVIGEDERARAWYLHALQLLAVEKTHPTTKAKNPAISREIYFKRAVEMIDKEDWRNKKMDEKLLQLSIAQGEAREHL